MKKPMAWGVLFLAVSAAAQDEIAVKSSLVTLASPPVISVMQGKAASVPLTFRVAKGYHINSNKPKSEYLIPTALKIDATTDIVITRVNYSDGQDMTFPFAPDEKLNVYTNDFRVDVMVRPLRSVQRGKYVVRGKLKYQACDNAQCYPPKQLPVTFAVRIAKAPPAARKNPAQSPHAHR